MKKNKKFEKLSQIYFHATSQQDVYYGGIFYFTYQTNFEHLLTLIM